MTYLKNHFHPTPSSILTVFVVFTSLSSVSVVDGAKVLIYPFGHCLNSHLLNAERLSEILQKGGHDVDMLVSTAYRGYDHHADDGSKMRRHVTESVATVNKTDSSSFSSSCTDSKGLLGSCSKYPAHSTLDRNGETTGHPGAKKQGSINLVEFASPENFVPVCEYDSLDFMISAPLADRFNALIDTSVKYCDRLLSDKALLRRLKNAQYSVIILESVDPCSRIIADYLDRPFVLLVTTGLGHFDSNPRPPSYLPAAIAPFTMSMTFPERVVNLLMKLMYDRAMPALMGFMEPFRELRRRHGYNSSLSLDDTFGRASLKLVNSDFSIDYPAPIEPDTVLIGGFAVRQPSALPADLQEFIDGSGDDGVIVASFGTLVRRYSPEWTSIFLQAFGKLRQRVIWRYHGEIANVTTEYPNIKLMKWLPQTNLLANPKTRLFISHCGLNGFFEAAHFGVPVLAIPLSGDQMNNAAKIADHLHMGIRMDITTMTTESLYSDIQRLLTDESFTRNARQVAARLDDQPMSAAERIIFWIDYIIRHDGAPHLRSGALDMPLYQYLSLDVIGVLLLGLIVLSVILLVCFFMLGRSLLRLTIFCSVRLYTKIRKCH